MQLKARIETSKGNININLTPDKTPITVASFANLAQKGFYEDLCFHRVISDFMIQGGCPQGVGTGSPGYKFEDEFNDDLKHDKAGILSMANSGPASNGSQFFVTHGPTPHLNNMHTVFGSVVSQEDQDIVNAIEQGDKIINIHIEGDTSELFEAQKDRIAEWNEILG